MALALGACVFRPPLEAVVADPRDRAIWREGAVPTLQIVSARGFGRVSLSPTATSRPKSPIQVALELRALEGLLVRSGGEVHRLEVTRSGSVRVDPAGSNVLHMNRITAIEEGFRFEVIVDFSNLAEDRVSFDLEWVDYYR